MGERISRQGTDETAADREFHKNGSRKPLEVNKKRIWGV
jgi:hypothetical protein